jgi:AraC-like DNA-binding protein
VELCRSNIEESSSICSEEQLGLYQKIAPAAHKMREEYAAPFSIEYLAKLCNMSRFYFCRVFKDAMGVTPLQYQTDCRLKIADILLCRPEWNIAQVAQAVGFEDEAYFSRCYKKHRGISPQKARAILSK